MRIGVVTWSSRLVAGTEAYLHRVLACLRDNGHPLALLCETSEPQCRDPIIDDPDVPIWSADQPDWGHALQSLRSWQPDVLFVHCPRDPEKEERLIGVAPAVMLAHNYHGMCISGQKATLWPVPQPCWRPFGPACLLHYLPHRCGGLNPVTMVRLFALQRRRRDLLPRYEAVLTLSEHMRQECVRHGVAPHRAITLPPAGMEDAAVQSPRRAVPSADHAWHLLFLGRLETLKGGQVLLDALPGVLAELRRPLALRFAGDGPRRAHWERQAACLGAAHQRIQVEFLGWVSGAAKRELFAGTDLLVLPSIWPEPFGLVGLEAAAHGVPAVAFDLGGVRQWLLDGETGCLAPGNPPTPTGLSGAIVRALRDENQHLRQCAAAFEHARRCKLSDHVEALQGILAAAADRARTKAFAPPALAREAP